MIDYSYFDNNKFFDSYVFENLGIFIPVADECFTKPDEYSFTSYKLVLDFSSATTKMHNYNARISSPGVMHKKHNCRHCYIILIEKEYFEKRYLMYAKEIPEFNDFEFDFCSDILKALNTFIFEVSKSMLNSDITLAAQTEIITHWTIRSMMGETLDMRAVSSDYSIARAQHYIEQHYAEAITLTKLADIGHMSVTTFNRHFKKEMGITPIDYLIEVRIRVAKLMLKRSDISITDVALRCGFGSASHFSSTFTERVGESPQEYRKSFANT